MQRLRIVWLILALVTIGQPRSAWAFCQTHTCEFSGTQMCTWDAAAGCWTGGAVAHWGSSCIDYAVQLDGSRDERISSTTLASVLEDGFRIWSDVSCGADGLTPELTASYRGLTRCDRVEFNCGSLQDNDNVVMFRDNRSDLSATTIALSTIIANTNTGEILDVDVEINSQDFDFYVDAANARPQAHDLRLVLNHELGHFLGLSHTLAPGALMRAAYDGTDRFPAPDDIAGMCKTLTQARTDPACSAEPSTGECVGSDATCPPSVQPIEESGGCSLAAPGRAGPTPAGGRFSLAWLLGTGLLLFVRGRSTRRRPRNLQWPNRMHSLRRAPGISCRRWSASASTSSR
jgi:hypothetical protein